MVSRRDILRVASRGAAAAIIQSSTSSQGAEAQNLRKTYVLVHGAGHGGWCWRHVRNALSDQGHRVFTPTLTGLGERVHLRNSSVSLGMHITDIVNVIEYEELTQVILVGHSYACRVITGVADQLRDKLHHVVYLDGTMPSDNEATIGNATAANAMRAQAIDGYLMKRWPPTMFGITESDVENTAWLNRRITEQPLETFLEPIQLENGGAIGLPKTFIRCTNPRMRNDDTMEKLIAATPDEWRYIELNVPHDAMIAAPEALTQILLDIA